MEEEGDRLFSNTVIAWAGTTGVFHTTRIVVAEIDTITPPSEEMPDKAFSAA
jgi:hypothetical protein